jgi:hypothetical protein
MSSSSSTTAPLAICSYSDDELKSFEALCENWRVIAEAELARRQSLPRSTPGAN